MCGIAGQVLAAGRSPDPELIGEMCAAIAHRGPDARGALIRNEAAIAIQRLRVIDPAGGDQPILNEDHTIGVVLNGEIYNYRELRSELISRGHRFRTHGDTEVIVHLYEELGTDCVRRLRGMFAFAIWDDRRRRLMLARDRVGKKPLLYSARDGGLAFGSEMSAMLADPTLPREIDPEAIDAYLALGYVPAPRTALKAVAKLPPAHTLLLENGRISLERYWRLDYADKPASLTVDEACEQVRASLREATRLRLEADVPLGAFLSGGIDSSAVVATMASLTDAPVRTFSIGFDDDRFDELPHARRIASQFGTRHEEFSVRADAVAVLPRIAQHHGEPFADPSAIPSFYLAEMTRRHVTVALNGDGGDECFGGYTRYVANALAGRLDAIPLRLRRAIASLGARLPAHGPDAGAVNRARRLAETLALTPEARYARYVSWFDRAARRTLYAPGFAPAEDLGEETIADAWRRASGSTVLDRALEVDATTYLVGDLIAKIDIATMTHGLEARSPFLDHELMQLAASLPADLKVRGTAKKWILRRAMRGVLPDEILDRPKQGFSVPLSRWLRGDLRSWTREVLLDAGTVGRGHFDRDAVEALLERHDRHGGVPEAKRIWALVMLELWHREVLDAPASAASAELAGGVPR
jgi:asparagine synthase (glutamine-hydrolysing)